MSILEPYTGPYPCPEVIYYGVPVWTLGEDAEQFMAGGHGRRAAAALSAHIRRELGLGWYQNLRAMSRDGKATRQATEEKWATFREECGCTPEQHAAHVADPRNEDNEVGGDLIVREVCEESGCTEPRLMPCAGEPEFAWLATYSSGLEPEDGLLPVTLVSL